MNASLRIALAYFSFVSLQTWLNWICGVMMAVGLVMELGAGSSYDLNHGVSVATFAVMLIVIAPMFVGGLVMRIASTPTILHLRPKGRRHMLIGATLAITLAAALLALPWFVAQTTGLPIPARAGYTHPGLGMFQWIWGGGALIWILVFAMSRYQTLAPFSFLVVVSLFFWIARMSARLPFSVDQFATGALVTGLVAWAAFALWYMRTRSVQRPGWISGWASGQPPPELEKLGNWRGFRKAAGEENSRSIALHQHLMGTDSMRPQFLVGAIITPVLMVANYFIRREEALQRDGATAGPMLCLVLVAVLGFAFAPVIVRRSRLLWLRAGLDRTALFAVGERHALRAALWVLSLPTIVFMMMGIADRPDQAGIIMLFVVLELTSAACFVYAGLTMTRAWSAMSLALITVLAIGAPVLASSMNPALLESAWAYLVGIAVTGTLAVVIRGFARRAWQKLDWRLAGPPLARLGIRGI